MKPDVEKSEETSKGNRSEVSREQKYEEVNNDTPLMQECKE